MQRTKCCFHFTVTAENNVFMFAICVTSECHLFQPLLINAISRSPHFKWNCYENVIKLYPQWQNLRWWEIQVQMAESTNSSTGRKCCLNHDIIKMFQEKLVDWCCLRAVLTGRTSACNLRPLSLPQLLRLLPFTCIMVTVMLLLKTIPSPNSSAVNTRHLH